MFSIKAFSDVTIDPIVKDVKEISEGKIIVKPEYSEDLVLKLMSVNELDLIGYDLVFIHTDQVFHQKDQQWQKTFFKAVNDLAGRQSKTILISNSCSQAYTSVPFKSSFGYGWDLDTIYHEDIGNLLKSSNVFVFDFLSLCMSVGSGNFYNYNLGHLYQMPYTKQAIKAIGAQFVNQVKWLFAEEKKAIILDCDNTLWKGIVGEDGVDGIKCDKNAEGILYYNFQLFLKAKREEGFLLCLCSKNNETDVKEAFSQNNFPLAWNDFTIKKVNWEDKIVNIKAIATELNISTDSFVFIDDNLFELNSVTEFLKGVSCFHMTQNYTDFLQLTNSFLFRRKQILQSDKEKSKQYEIEQLREHQKTGFTSLADFIKSLEIKMDIRVNDMYDLERLSQMTGKTNQFNFNKHSYSNEDLKIFIEKGNAIYSLKVADKYGDYGTVGLILMKIDGKNAIMENYLMSCRALGKGIEKKFYEDVLNKLAKEKIKLKEIRFVKTDKNLPAQEFSTQIKYDC